MSGNTLAAVGFTAAPLLTGAYVAVESVTFGKWKSECGPLNMMRRFTGSDKAKPKADDDEVSSSTNSVHLYTGLALAMVGTVSTAALVVAKPKTFARVATPTLTLSLTLVGMLFVYDNIVDYFGIANIDECLPDWDNGYTTTAIVTLCIYMFAAALMSFSYVFI